MPQSKELKMTLRIYEWHDKVESSNQQSCFGRTLAVE